MQADPTHLVFQRAHPRLLYPEHPSLSSHAHTPRVFQADPAYSFSTSSLRAHPRLPHREHLLAIFTSSHTPGLPRPPRCVHASLYPILITVPPTTLSFLAAVKLKLGAGGPPVARPLVRRLGAFILFGFLSPALIRMDPSSTPTSYTSRPLSSSSTSGRHQLPLLESTMELFLPVVSQIGLLAHAAGDVQDTIGSIVSVPPSRSNPVEAFRTSTSFLDIDPPSSSLLSSP
ncbi:hypothetical protein C8R46DRAFT_1220620 [Mycena filopes]|nr:hypothetical protein C8R46DRAFT_1220620 [Mycena filopes]